MGFYSLETLKEDARWHGVQVPNPDINHSLDKCIIKDESLLLGFPKVDGVGEAAARSIIGAREWDGPFASLAAAMQRTGLQRESVEYLVRAGAFDTLFLIAEMLFPKWVFATDPRAVSYPSNFRWSRTC